MEEVCRDVVIHVAALYVPMFICIMVVMIVCFLLELFIDR